MIYYTNNEAQNIRDAVASQLGEKFDLLDLFCKVTPKLGEPYFLPSSHTYVVAAAGKALGIEGHLMVFPGGL